MGRKDSAGNQAGTARMTVGDRFWARRIRPIFDDGDLTLEQKSVFCCIVARDPMSVAIECPARFIAAAEAGLPRRDYDEALAALERGGYIVDIVTPYGEDRDGELCMVPIPAEVVREGCSAVSSAKERGMAAQPAGRTRDELDETFEILDRDGAVVVFGGDLMERGFGIVSAKATEDTRLSSSAKGVYAYFCAHAGAGTHSLFPSVDTICTHLAMSRNTYYHRRTLVECGYISVHQGRAQGQGRYLSNRYVVNAEIPEERRFVPVDNSKSTGAGAVENLPGEGVENEVINNPQDSPCTKNWYTGDQTNVSLQLDSPCTNFWYTGPTGKTISPCTNFLRH